MEQTEQDGTVERVSELPIPSISEANYDAGISAPVDAVGIPLSGGVGKISPATMTGEDQ